MATATKKAHPKNQPESQPSLKAKYEKTKNLLENFKTSIQAALPSNVMTVERFTRGILTAISKTPGVMDCTPYSIMGAVMTCAQLGLIPDADILGEMYLKAEWRHAGSPHARRECQVMMGYRGLCTLAVRSGRVISISARAVYEGDTFEYEFGLNEKLIHKPCGESDKEKITNFYSIIKLVGGGHMFEVIPRKEMDELRDENDNYKYAVDKTLTFWHRFYVEMAKKTVLRRNMKLAPMSADVARAIGLDEAADVGVAQNFKLEILEDLATDEEMKEAVYAEVQNDLVAKAKDDDAKRVDEVKSRVKKGEDATLKAIKDNKPARPTKKADRKKAVKKD